jgi:hypothetical protein
MVEIWVPFVVGAGGAILALTNYLDKVRAERELEALKRELQIHGAERQIRFSNLYERRGERIADFYGRIAELLPMCERYVQRLEQERHEGLSELTKRLADFCLFFETSQIYLPERICILLEKNVTALRTALSDAAQEEKTTFTAAVRGFEAVIPATQKALKEEFRKMFGPESSP